MILTVTGHRPKMLGGYGRQARWKLVRFAMEVLELIKPHSVITGMAIGWDQAIAGACVRMKIPYTAAIPGVWQSRRWPSESVEVYNYLLDHASKVDDLEYPAEQFKYAMGARNRHMIDHCDHLLALWSGCKGGTHNAIHYAQGIGIEVTNAWDKWLKYA